MAAAINKKVSTSILPSVAKINMALILKTLLWVCQDQLEVLVLILVEFDLLSFQEVLLDFRFHQHQAQLLGQNHTSNFRWYQKFYRQMHPSIHGVCLYRH